MVLLMSQIIVRAQQVWQVSLDTSSLNGQTGFLDLQFNPGGLDALAGTIAFDHVVTDGSLASVATLTGSASGALPGPPAATIDNSTQYNDLFQGITFGNQVSFHTTLSGAALNPVQPFPASGSTFAVSLYDTTGTMPLLTTSTDGSMAHIDIKPDGTTSTTLFADSNGMFDASVALLPSSVPETTTLVSLFIGMGGIGIILRSRPRSRCIPEQ
jgi:hypothetical protein